MQEPPLEEKELHTILESPRNEDTPAKTPSPGSQSSTQEPRLEEETLLESPTNEETLAEAPSTMETQDVSPQQVVETSYEMDAESANNAFETEEQPTASETSAGRRYLTRARRPTSLPRKMRPLCVLRRMIWLDWQMSPQRHTGMASLIHEFNRRIKGSLN